MSYPNTPTVKDPDHFVRTQVNTPLSFSKLQIPLLFEAKDKKDRSNVKKRNFFFDPLVMKDNMIHVSKQYLQTCKGNSVFDRESLLGDDEDLPPPCVETLLKVAMSKINSSIAMATTTHFELFNDDGSKAHEIFKQRCQITNNLHRDMQSIVNESIRFGLEFGKDSGQMEIREIVGNRTQANLHFFSHGSFEALSSYQKVGFKIELEQDRSIAIKKKTEGVQQLWKEVGGLIEAFVLFQVRILTDTTNSEISMVDAETAHTSGIEDSVLDALNEGFHLGYYAGFQVGQTRYKARHELNHNKWIYSFVKKSCDDAIYVSTESLLSQPNLKRPKFC